jgi:hypothetical protein
MAPLQMGKPCHKQPLNRVIFTKFFKMKIQQRRRCPN